MLFLNVRRHTTVLGKFHRERALALRHAAQVGRVAERFGQRHFAFDRRDRTLHVRRRRSVRGGY